MRLSGLFYKFAGITFIILFRGPSYGQDSWSFPDFSATQVFQGHRTKIEMKVFRSGSSVRVERSAALSTLYVPSNRKIYNFSTYPDSSHQCVVMTPKQARMLPSPLELIHGKVIKRSSAATETVEGHKCKVENVVVSQPDGTTIESKVWEAEYLKGIPVRIQSHFPDVLLDATYKDISIGPPDSHLFMVPVRCTPYEKMGQVVENRVVK